MEICDPQKLLREKGIHATKKKTEILHVILSSEKLISAGEIFNTVRNGISIDLATVYRTLAILKESGIVREITDSAGTQFYEKACKHNPPHPHFRCRICNKMKCLPPCIMDEKKYFESLPENCDVESLSVLLNGVCEKCKE